MRPLQGADTENAARESKLVLLLSLPGMKFLEKEVGQCRNLIENARTAKVPGNATPVMEQAGWRYRRERCALPAIRMAAESVRTAAAWADLMPPAIPHRAPMFTIDDRLEFIAALQS